MNKIDYIKMRKDQQRVLGIDTDKVCHPSHYTTGNIEVIDAIEDWKLGMHEGNVIKYVARAKFKDNELQDLKKARWYLDRKITLIETKENE